MSRLREFALSPYGRPILQVERAAIAAVVAVNTLAGRFSARRQGHPPTHEHADQQLTVVVKTFERAPIARRFVRHAREVFGGRIVIVDDSRRPMTAPDEGVDVLALPFDSGVSTGRNAGLAAVRTPYVLMADDDHILTRSVHLDEVLSYLERNPQVDAVAFTVIEIPRLYSIDFGPESNALFPGHEPLKIPYGTEIDGLRVQAKTAQCYVARTDALRAVGWDDALRMLDHSDLFSRAAGRMVFVQHPTMRVLHGRTPWRRAFTEGRHNVNSDAPVLAARWGGVR